MRWFVIFALLLLPVTASALDCTPFQSWTCDQSGYFDYLDGVPGEVICGVDYTGWTLHVIEVTITQPGWYQVGGISASSSGNIVDTAIIQMDDCGAGTCVTSVQENSGVTELGVCLDAGTYSFVVASDTTAPTGFVNMDVSCFTCAEVETWGLDCPLCSVVGNQGTSWGSLKSRFK